MGEGDGPLAFAESVESADEEMGVGVGGIVGEEVAGFLDFGEVADQGAEIGDAGLDAGDDGDFVRFLRGAFREADEFSDGVEGVGQRGFIGGVEGKAGDGLAGAGGGDKVVGAEEGLGFEFEAIDLVIACERGGGLEGGVGIAGEGREIGGFEQEDVAGGGIVFGGGGLGEEEFAEGLAIGGGGFGVIGFEEVVDEEAGFVLGDGVGDRQEGGCCGGHCLCNCGASRD